MISFLLINIISKKFDIVGGFCSSYTTFL